MNNFKRIFTFADETGLAKVNEATTKGVTPLIVHKKKTLKKEVSISKLVDETKLGKGKASIFKVLTSFILNNSYLSLTFAV